MGAELAVDPSHGDSEAEHAACPCMLCASTMHLWHEYLALLQRQASAAALTIQGPTGMPLI
jgi:hypothetical protein